MLLAPRSTADEHADGHARPDDDGHEDHQHAVDRNRQGSSGRHDAPEGHRDGQRNGDDGHDAADRGGLALPDGEADVLHHRDRDDGRQGQEGHDHVNECVNNAPPYYTLIVKARVSPNNVIYNLVINGWFTDI